MSDSSVKVLEFTSSVSSDFHYSNIVHCGIKQLSFLSCKIGSKFLSSQTASAAQSLVFSVFNIVLLNKLSCLKMNCKYTCSSPCGSSKNFLIINGHVFLRIKITF